MNNEKIFVQIAAYRDPELVNTLESLITNADNPENLVICIAFQSTKDDIFSKDMLPYFEENRCTIKIIYIDSKDSKGACWARHEIQKRYNNEKYTLQLDSHHRFVKGWDTITKEMYHNLIGLGFKKPLLTAYLPSYEPNNDPKGRVMDPWKMNFDRYTPEGVVFFLPATIDEWRSLFLPIRARFYSAHFAFTTGDFSKEVMHNPEYYFHGEEISIAARAYTWGYDLFHPHKLVAWHEYTRNGRTKHWEDSSTWSTHNNNSLKINRELFGMDGHKQKDFGKYGFGTVRTLEDYEKYSGLKFNIRGIQQHTLDNKYPPNPHYDNNLDYENSFVREYKHCIDIYKDTLVRQDYQFIAVIVEDENNTSLYRHDMLENEINNLFEIKEKESKNFHNIWVKFVTDKKPSRYIIWPYIRNIGWSEKIVGNI
jgi:hypothetical protein